MEDICFTLVRPRTGGPVSCGLPLPESLLSGVENLQLVGSDGIEIIADYRILGRWPDQSMRWLLVQCVPPDSCSGSDRFRLRLHPSVSMPEDQVLTVDCSNKQVSIGDSSCQLVVDVNTGSWFPVVSSAGSGVETGGQATLVLEGTNGTAFNCISSELHVVSAGHVSAEFCVSSVFQHATDQQELHVRCGFRYFRGGYLEYEIEIHNPDRARHKNGLWDLGDPGSVCFNVLGIRLSLAQIWKRALTCQSGEPLQEIAGADYGRLLQASSGGENWDSINHCDASGIVPCQYRGYRFERNGYLHSRGDRAEPSMTLTHPAGAGLRITPLEFWQNFPSAIEVTPEFVQFDVFPAMQGHSYELQGGEKKTHSFAIRIGDELASWDGCKTMLCESVSAMTAAALRYTSVGGVHSPYDELLQQSLCPQRGFVAAREKIDEYGWRNFGELFANHETLYQVDASQFISHYNNQYDGIYGFARQYLLTGDKRWYELMRDLARHVLDIDIYHTDRDKAEYNHGLFWHTDHYKPAATSTHRTYSEKQFDSDWNGPLGGGPGAEHCYTSGLTLYFYLTGDQRAKDTVLNLQHWIGAFYDGNGSLLHWLYRLLTRDSKVLIRVLRRAQPLRYEYPFDRGVGNFIRALLDSYDLTCDLNYLRNVEFIIHHTFSAGDDISDRDLDNIEGTWFYTVFLQEVVRYLDTKRSVKEFDQQFSYALNAFLHYARWMAVYETPYLSRADRLEYPNHTWVAQEVRKSCVLYAAYRYSSSEREEFLDRARFFRDYVVENLREEPTLYFARIQCLLLQNHGPHLLLDQESAPYSLPELPASEVLSSHQSVVGLALSCGRRLTLALRSFSLRREIQWLRTRVI